MLDRLGCLAGLIGFRTVEVYYGCTPIIRLDATDDEPESARSQVPPFMSGFVRRKRTPVAGFDRGMMLP
jgi:hypothetical protein